MQRSGYPPAGPAQSPPLHHPVPQHVSTVPQLRSPPPSASQPQSANGYSYGAQPGIQGQAGSDGYMHPAFGGFMNDSTAQMGFQVGKSAVAAGQDYMEKNFNTYVNVSALKHYFNVSNSYVVNKLFVVLFPWRHRPWTRRQAMGPNGQDSVFLPPREDINSPDMYIPLMAFVTFVLLSTLLAGLRGAFNPQLFAATATTASVVVMVEILLIKIVCYLLGIKNESQIWDLFAYSGYKFVGIIVTIIAGEIANRGQGTGGWVGWTVFMYTFLALAFFLLRSLKYVLLPENSPTGPGAPIQPVARTEKSKRTQFLFAYSYIVQFGFMWLLTRQ